MSGAEAAIAGVGFLCNAMQIVTFGRDILQVYCQVRDGRSPDPRLEGYLESAEICFSQMNLSAATQTHGLNSDQEQIVNVGQKLHDSMAKLQSKFAALHLHDVSKRGIHGKLRVGKKAVASIWYSKELKSLEENLKRYEGLFHSAMLHRLCNQVQATEIQSNQNFQQLNTGLQSFIIKLADGCTKISELSLVSLETRDQMAQEHERTRTALSLGFSSTQGTVSDIRDSASQYIHDSAQRELRRDLESRQEKLLESLRFSEMNSRKSQVSENFPGTFSWVFQNTSYCTRNRSPSPGQTDNKETDNDSTDNEDTDDDISTDDPSESMSVRDLPSPDNFPTWLESESKLFWISGKPASGKSSLVKFLATSSHTIEHLKKWQRNIQTTDGKLHIITHFFWKPGRLLQRNTQGMLLSLLYQVLYRNPCLAQRLWKDLENVLDKRVCGDWSLKELSDALFRAIKSSSDVFCIFLDGLDEAKGFETLSWRDGGDTQVIRDLLRLSNVKLCASSREEHPFTLFFEGHPRLKIHLLTYGDICRFARKRLEVSGLNSTNRTKILQIVVEKANGVFLWVVLVLDSLNRAIRSGTASTDELQERLAQTPADLTNLLIDMWERSGDDAKLSSYRNDASRYLSLVVTANKIREDLRYADERNSMHSLVVMASALEDEPLASILDTGRYIQVNDLQARCARVSNRLPLISRGLLEMISVTGPGESRMYAGNSRLLHYETKRIEFIHRSAFDFITDTQVGRECLSACHWSPNVQVHRLLTGHLIRSRFIYAIPDAMVLRTSKIHYIMREIFSMELHRALAITYGWRDGDLHFENSMLRIISGWQKSGLFYSTSYWTHPSAFRVCSNPLDLEFLEKIATTAPRFTIIADLLDNVSIDYLISAIPVLLRGLRNMDLDVMVESMYLELIGDILTRLTKASSERRQDVPSQSKDDIRSATFLLHSWFLVQCLWNTCIPNIFHGRESEWGMLFDLLNRFKDTLSSADDWQYPLVLSFGENDFLEFSPQGIYCCMMPTHTIVAIVNLATAYRILSRLVENRLPHTLYAQAPQESSERFEVVLISGEGKGRGCPAEMFSPAAEYHDLIAGYLEITMLRFHTRNHRSKREEARRAFVQSISDGLTLVGDDSVGYCVRELGKRGLEYLHPWQNNWNREDRNEDSMEE